MSLFFIGLGIGLGIGAILLSYFARRVESIPIDPPVDLEIKKLLFLIRRQREALHFNDPWVQSVIQDRKHEKPRYNLKGDKL